MKYATFPKGLQKKFISSCKKKSKLTWDQFAERISISRSLVFYYLSEKCKIPIQTIQELSSLYTIPIPSHKISELKHSKKRINIPPFSENLAEILGVLAGDGHINNSEVCITSHRVLDLKHILYCKELFFKVFQTKGNLTYQKNVVKLRYYSRDLVRIFNINYNHPIGKKKGSLQIPKEINTRKLAICYIRGLFDTDGSIYNHHKKKSATVEICSRDPSFLEQVNKTLIKLGFTTSKNYKSVKIYRQLEIQKFFKTIKPSNPKHVKKWKIFLKKGVVPKNKDMLQLMRG